MRYLKEITDLYLGLMVTFLLMLYREAVLQSQTTTSVKLAILSALVTMAHFGNDEWCSFLFLSLIHI